MYNGLEMAFPSCETFFWLLCLVSAVTAPSAVTKDKNFSPADAVRVLEAAGVTARHVTLVTPSAADARAFLRQDLSARDRSVRVATLESFCQLERENLTRSVFARQSLVLIHGLAWSETDEPVIRGDEEPSCFDEGESFFPLCS